MIFSCFFMIWDFDCQDKWPLNKDACWSMSLGYSGVNLCKILSWLWNGQKRPRETIHIPHRFHTMWIAANHIFSLQSLHWIASQPQGKSNWDGCFSMAYVTLLIGRDNRKVLEAGVKLTIAISMMRQNAAPIVDANWRFYRERTVNFFKDRHYLREAPWMQYFFFGLDKEPTKVD